MKFVEFIFYEVIEPVLKPSEQLTFSKDVGFNVVNYEVKNKQ